jgi:hypothetical protein
MYGWKLLDDPSLTRDWPAGPSLSIDIRPHAASHSLYWFNECVREEGKTHTAYCIEGTVTFEDLEVRRAGATLQPLDEFIGYGIATGRLCMVVISGSALRPSELRMTEPLVAAIRPEYGDDQRVDPAASELINRTAAIEDISVRGCAGCSCTRVAAV